MMDTPSNVHAQAGSPSSTRWLTYSDFHQASSYGKFPQEHRSSHGKLPLRMLKVDQSSHNFIDPAIDETLLSLSLTVKGECTWSWKIEDWIPPQQVSAGRMLLVPSETESFWEVQGERTILVLSLPNDTIRNVLGASCPPQLQSAFWSLSQDAWVDPFLEVLLKRLWESLASASNANGFLADGLLTSILSQLLIKAGTDIENNSIVALPEWRLNRVRRHVDANLEKEISLDDLAEAAGLSRRHFARSFHQQVGETPHRWMMQLRLEKAKHLLKTTEQPLADISITCGFSSQSHLTSALKQATGLTPAKWRQLYYSCPAGSLK